MNPLGVRLKTAASCEEWMNSNHSFQWIRLYACLTIAPHPIVNPHLDEACG